MLDVKEAAQRASEYFAGLYADEGVLNVQLEEVELTDDGQYWLITLSYPMIRSGEMSGIPINLAFRRKYKVFKIDSRTGEVKSMKMRNIE